MKKQIGFRVDAKVYKAFQIILLQKDTNVQQVLEKFVNDYVKKSAK